MSKQPGIVERLRGTVDPHNGLPSLPPMPSDVHDAIAEITRLRGLLEEATEALEKQMHTYVAYRERGSHTQPSMGNTLHDMVDIARATIARIRGETK